MQRRRLLYLAAGFLAMIVVAAQGCAARGDDGSHVPGAPASGRVDREAAPAASFAQRPDSEGHRRYRAVSRRFFFTGEHARDTSILVGETITRDCCSGREKSSAATIRLDGWVDETSTERAPDWTDSLEADDGELAGSSRPEFYRAILRGCCDTADLLTYIDLVSGKPRFFMSRYGQPSGVDLPTAFDWLNQEFRFAAFHDTYAASPPPESRDDKTVVGALQYGAADGPVQRVVVRRTNGSAGDYRLSRVGFARGDSIADDQIRVGDEKKDHSIAEGFTGFALLVELQGMDAPWVTLRVPITHDSLDLARATVPTGFTLR